MTGRTTHLTTYDLDRLAQIPSWVLFLPQDEQDYVLALVEIARAARQVNETLHLRARTTAADEARLTQWGVELNALNVALARMDSENTQ